MKCSNRKLFKEKRESTATPSPTVKEEVENVEYLDDCFQADVEEVNEATTPHHSAEADATFEDTFYPNAVQCLIALYRLKYDQQMNDQLEIRNMRKSIWEDISRDMRESYFDFDADQVQQKFTQLRRQYFGVSSKVDAEKFEYLHQFHEMYNDKIVASFLNAESTAVFNTRKTNTLNVYRDDELFSLSWEPEIDVVADKQKHIDEIAHKEHEFMDLVERELRAMDDDNSKLKYKTEPAPNKSCTKRKQDLNEVDISNAHTSKQLKANNATIFRSTKLDYPEPSELSETKVQSEVSNDEKSDMTLAAYNEAQQLRHEEKMNLFRQTLLLQERVIEIQSKLLEKIINRI